MAKKYGFKNIISFLLAIILMVTMVFSIPMNVNAMESSEVKSKLDALITQYPAGSTNPQKNCWYFVNMLSQNIFGHAIPTQSTDEEYKYYFTDSYKTNFIQIGQSLTIKDGTLTENSLKNLLSSAQPGDVIQMDYTTWRGADRLHVMMVYSASSTGAVFYHAGSTIYFGAGSGSDKLNLGTTGKELTWSQLKAYFYDYDDGISLYRSKTVNTCNHSYGGTGICSSCNYQFPYNNDRNTSYAGTYKVKSGATAYIRKGPYQKCTEVTRATSGNFTVVARVLNCKGNYWYELSYNGSTCYVVSTNLEKVSHQHSWVFQYYRSAHPHYNFYRCSSCNAEKNDTNSSNFSSACDTCTKPGSSTISTNSLSVYTNQKVKFTWTSTSNTTSYCLKYRDPSYSYITVATTTATTYEFVFTEAGNYCVYVDSLNEKGQYTQSNLLYIEVKEEQIHTHIWDEIESLEEHPHYARYQCTSCGQIKTDTSKTYYHGYCDICLQPGKPSFINLISSYYLNENIIFSWEETKSTTHYNFWLYKKNNDGEWAQYEHSRYVTSDFARKLPEGEYYCKLQSYNSEHWRDDGTDWLYTESDYYYFTVSGYNYSKRFRNNNHTYDLYEQCVTWAEAKAICEEKGGHLVTISNNEELSFLNSLIVGNVCWTAQYLNTVKDNIYFYSGINPSQVTTVNMFICEYDPYTISFDSNGGDGIPTPIIKAYDETAYLYIEAPTREGYKFIGWSTDPNATAGTYWYGSAYTENSSVTLYAVWKPESFGEKYDYDDNLYYYSYKVDGVNTNRGVASVILYNQNYGSNTMTNEYGCEASIDATGRVISNVYGVGSATIPNGGFVLSSHSTQDNVFVTDYVKIGDYVYFDSSRETVYVFPTQEKMNAFLSCRHGHSGTEVVKNQVNATYESFGYTGDTCCSVCNELIYYGKYTEMLIQIGDVDGDGVCNIRDATILRRYVAKWDGVTVNELAADVNNDGVVNIRDATTLRRYVAKWDGYEDLPYTS